MKGFLTGRGAHARRTGLGGATAVLRRPTAVLLALLMMLSVVVVIGATTATEAEAYGECIVTVERPEDPDPNIAEMNGLTDVFIKAHGNVGMISNGVGLLGTSPHINPQEIDMAHVDITSEGPDTTYTKIPPNADIERAFLYWAGTSDRRGWAAVNSRSGPMLQKAATKWYSTGSCFLPTPRTPALILLTTSATSSRTTATTAGYTAARSRI